MYSISISDIPVKLAERSKRELKGITVGDSINFSFFDGTFNGMPLMFIKPKHSIPTPREMGIVSSRMETLFGMPIVFTFEKCPAYQRKRLIEKGIYFVVNDGYAYLPMLIANTRIKKTKISKYLSPTAQYVLLYHLQVQSIEGRSALDIQYDIPYSYSGIALALTQLESFGLCTRISNGSKAKTLKFNAKGEDLWNMALPFMTSPVEKRVFCDKLLTNEKFTISNLNALAHYTRISSGPEVLIAVSSDKLQKLEKENDLVHPNEYDGDVEIEVWKYPPVVFGGFKSDYVDRMSLALSLKDNDDARVENEVERLIKGTQWKG